MNATTAKNATLAALTLGALGVVYGDIGTSPLYAFREALTQSGSGSNPSVTSATYSKRLSKVVRQAFMPGGEFCSTA